MLTEEIRKDLFLLQDKKYRDFQAKLIPTAAADSIIGVRTPELRKYAHQYFDENQLHAFILSEMKDYEKCIEEVSRFLPYIDNWATCDQLSPKVFKKHRQELLNPVKIWICSDQTYTIRFAVGMLMEHFLNEDFDRAYPEMVSGIRSEEYYVNMMTAWYFATALAKQYDAVLPYIEGRRLDVWTHNKAIQKAVESYRIAPEQKEYLKSLKIKKK